ncbi:class I SAM-dependent methyltransferase [Serratia fonticola]|jgi:ubiquinone/menaquinone biosynthesis C-methylase UbiE|uniref:Class I SAM-dependent methyltransferase n=1 Tax=Serratia fonticola TaxID=47917 RepID=A0AAE7JSS0_SERFO|nr:class I SAM-dependent methyltransferase [Serratia fonticola]ATM77251.1 class I SAM-dependent methyltransferase [Serratia fonticola]MBC3218122.1 class I SAM-dependent methyltransferase [Serratia fonticola]MBL5906039.1 class I SAM-dependent methyltransferase [Serratia fonticola]MDQ9129623.1 class I SAM-dependent methyltransferase [Serratia fonticola]NCG51193.1 methyltransferase domain-containing protein [Serratia fonticola]
MSQNIYDNQTFFDGYAQLSRSVQGLDGAPEWPTIRSILPDLQGKKVVDLGCGYGWFCRSAREQGAAQVLGMDLSEKMLGKAKEMTEDPAIEYRQQDLEALQLPAASFDLVYSSLTLHYIEDLGKLFATVYQALVNGGEFIFTAEHPIYTAPKHQGWLVDEAGQKSWPINGYQQEGQRISNWLAEGVIKQHRMLGTYINLLVQQGFTIRYLNEWGPSAQQIADNPALDEEKERPMIFILAVQKPAA